MESKFIYSKPESEVMQGCMFMLCAVSYGDDGIAGNPMTSDQEHSYEY